jgi:hypothetical protein
MRAIYRAAIGLKQGFDNSPDPRVIRFKYGKIDKDHRVENVPHMQSDDKTCLSLMEEMTFAEFVRWLKSNL